MLAVLTAALLALAAPTGGADGPRYALIPPRDLSGNPAAPGALAGALRACLEARGARFAAPEEVDALLRARRIRYTDSLSRADLAALGTRLEADFVLLATVLDYVPGGEPRLAFSLRALETGSGRRVASSAVALRGADFEGLLGLGRIEDIDALLQEGLERALEGFDASGAPVPPRARRAGRPRPPAGGRGFVRDDFDPRALERVALLPLENRSSATDAAVQLGEFLGDAWARGGRVRVCEIADVRATLIAQKVRSMEYLDLAHLAEVGRGLGVRYFVMGSIESYGQEVLVDDRRYPELEATLRLLDVEQGRIVAAAAVRRTGNDYETVLGLGAVHDPAELGIRVARELVTAIGG